MDKGLVFWIVFLVWILVSGFRAYRTRNDAAIAAWWGDVLCVAIMLFLLGWGVFGFIVR